MTNKYTYNYKELNEDFGLNWHDYGARWYDAALGRWWVVDPLLEITPDWSSYNYVENTPINAIDPDGMACAGCNNDNTEDNLRKEDNVVGRQSHMKIGANLAERAWTWLRSGGKESMDKDGREYVNARKRGGGRGGAARDTFPDGRYLWQLDADEWDMLGRKTGEFDWQYEARLSQTSLSGFIWTWSERFYVLGSYFGFTLGGPGNLVKCWASANDRRPLL